MRANTSVYTLDHYVRTIETTGFPLLASGSPHYVMKRAAEEAPEASKKQAFNPKAVGDLSHYHVDWSMQTCGEDYHMGGYDFKRSNVKGKLMFT